MHLPLHRLLVKEQDLQIVEVVVDDVVASQEVTKVGNHTIHLFLFDRDMIPLPSTLVNCADHMLQPSVIAMPAPQAIAANPPMTALVKTVIPIKPVAAAVKAIMKVAADAVDAVDEVAVATVMIGTHVALQSTLVPFLLY